MSLAKELEGQGHEASAVAGERSQFDVIVDGELVFSKQQELRFPELHEITARLG